MAKINIRFSRKENTYAEKSSAGISRTYLGDAEKDIKVKEHNRWKEVSVCIWLVY